MKPAWRGKCWDLGILLQVHTCKNCEALKNSHEDHDLNKIQFWHQITLHCFRLRKLNNFCAIMQNPVRLPRFSSTKYKCIKWMLYHTYNCRWQFFKCMTCLIQQVHFPYINTGHQNSCERSWQGQEINRAKNPFDLL